MGTTSEKLTYLNTTKGKIKDSINLTGANITTEPFRQYSTKLENAYIDIINNGTDTLYNNFPKVSGEGTSLTLNNTYQAPMRNNLKGNTSQTGTPTPTSPIPVNVVSGDNTITISNQSGTDSNTYNIDLPVENLFNKNTTNILNGYISNTGFNSYANNRTIYIPTIVGQTYTIQKTIGNGNLLYAFTENTPTIGTQTLLGRTDASSKVVTTTAPTNGNYLAITIYRDADNSFTVDEVLGGLQIEKGSKANSYTPYGTTPIELCKIGNYQDYFYKDSGKWYLHKEIGKVTYNGTENWTTFAINYEYQIILQDAKEGDFENQFFPSLCNKYVNHNVGGASLNNYEFSNFTSGVYRWIRIRHNDITTLANYKTWLASNTPTFYYLLATPTNTEITDTTLINQLEELYIAKSKENQTNISQVNNDLGFIISASALKKG